MLEEEKLNYEKREAHLILQKKEMQMEIQRLNERENKRRKMIVAANSTNLQNNNINMNSDNHIWLKSKLNNCNIF